MVIDDLNVVGMAALEVEASAGRFLSRLCPTIASMV
jgi:hypothetical protein